LNGAWQPSDGGELVDISGGQRVAPRLNTFVVFKPPHAHEVTQVEKGALPRISLFGWLLERGESLPQPWWESSCAPDGAGVFERFSDALWMLSVLTLVICGVASICGAFVLKYQRRQQTQWHQPVRISRGRGRGSKMDAALSKKD
jgi:hypothetical protein